MPDYAVGVSSPNWFGESTLQRVTPPRRDRKWYAKAKKGAERSAEVVVSWSLEGE